MLGSHPWRAIAVIGPGAADAEAYQSAERVGTLLAQEGIAIVCGGRGGVMEAVCKGARGAGGLTVGILPGVELAEANEYIQVPIVTGLGEGRNALVVRSAQAVIAIAGEYGTLSEIAFALKFRKPVIGLNTWVLSKRGPVRPEIKHASSAEEAVDMALRAVGWRK